MNTLYSRQSQPKRKEARARITNLKNDDSPIGKGLRRRHRVLKTQKSFSSIKQSYMEQLNEEPITPDLEEVMNQEMMELSRLMKLNKCFGTIFLDTSDERDQVANSILRKYSIRKKSD